jgi:hypothetical protein
MDERVSVIRSRLMEMAGADGVSAPAFVLRVLLIVFWCLTVLILVLLFIEGRFEELLVACFATAEAENLSGGREIIGLGTFGQGFATGSAGGTETGCDLSGVF